MGISKLYLSICFVTISITRVYGIEKTDSLYKVLKIKTAGDYYVIYAQRNDSLFKVISKKVPLEKRTDLELLRKGLCYYFDFGKKENEASKDRIEPLSGIINNLDVKNNHVFFCRVRCSVSLLPCLVLSPNTFVASTSIFLQDIFCSRLCKVITATSHY
jgi:hypothetical protein